MSKSKNDTWHYRKYYQKNKERLQQRSRRYYEMHKTERINYQHNYNVEHRNQIKDYKQRNTEKHREYQGRYQLKYRRVHKDKTIKTNQEHYEKHKEQLNNHVRERRTIVLAHYGNKCSCCGESEIAFLAIDHINGVKNAEDYKEFGKRIGGYTLYNWLIKHKFPTGYRILCYNCNWAIANLGYCPHKEPKWSSGKNNHEQKI